MACWKHSRSGSTQAIFCKEGNQYLGWSMSTESETSIWHRVWDPRGESRHSLTYHHVQWPMGDLGYWTLQFWTLLSQRSLSPESIFLLGDTAKFPLNYKLNSLCLGTRSQEVESVTWNRIRNVKYLLEAIRMKDKSGRIRQGAPHIVVQVGQWLSPHPGKLQSKDCLFPRWGEMAKSSYSTMIYSLRTEVFDPYGF